MKRKWVNVFLLCMLTVCVKAQTEGYHYYCNIDSIKTSGFYRIALDPKLNAHIKADFSDIRIVNDAGRWIPHVLSAPKFGATTASNIEFEKTFNSHAATELILKGVDAFVETFDLIIRNTSVSRVAKLSGSDNRQDWFVILDSLLLTPIVTGNKGETKYHIDFPSCNYKYYKLVIDNKANDPVNIIQVTTPIWPTNTVARTISINQPGFVFQKDSGKITYIRITQAENFHIDELELTVSGVKYYYRKLDIYMPADEGHSFSNPGTLLRSFYLSNNSALTFSLPHINPKVFYLSIYNEDNLPLRVDAIRSWSDARYLTAYLEKGGGYKLIMDNPSATTANYDLTKLNNIIPDSVQLLGTEKITAFEEKKSVSSTEKNNRWLLWVAIAIAIIILFFFTSKMLKEVDKRKAA